MTDFENKILDLIFKLQHQELYPKSYETYEDGYMDALNAIEWEIKEGRL